MIDLNNYYPCAVELEIDAVNSREVKIQNPNYIEGKPAFSFGYSTVSPGKRFQKILDGESGNSIERSYILKLRSDLIAEIPVPVSLGKVEKHVEEKTEELRSEGNAVYLTPNIFGKIYWVYVAELKEGAAGEHKMIEVNPHWKGKLPPFYVGMTGKSIKQRIKDHMKGKTGSQLVRAYYLKLRPDLYEHRNGDGLRSWEAEELEVLIAKELRKEEFAVFQR